MYPRVYALFHFPPSLSLYPSPPPYSSKFPTTYTVVFPPFFSLFSPASLLFYLECVPKQPKQYVTPYRDSVYGLYEGRSFGAVLLHVFCVKNGDRNRVVRRRSKAPRCYCCCRAVRSLRWENAAIYIALRVQVLEDFLERANYTPEIFALNGRKKRSFLLILLLRFF